MNKTNEALLELSEELYKLPEIKEFLQLKEAIEKDEELKAMRLEIARLTNEGKKQEHDNLLNVYNSHPLVVNYLIARDEAAALLTQIKDILSD